MKQRKISAAGFSLIELAMVVLVGGIVMTGAAAMLLSYLRELNITTTQTRMQEIDNALAHYVSINGVLPCVAVLNDAQDITPATGTASEGTFGRQITDINAYPLNAPPVSAATPVGTPGDCYSAAAPPGTPGTLYPPTAAPGAKVFITTGVTPGTPPDTRTQTTNSNGFIVIGAVPVRTLGIPDQDIADAWGDRFTYAVTYALTVPGSYDPSQGSIIVQDSSASTPPPNDLAIPHGSAQYVIVSYGENRGGAYTIGGAKYGTTCSATETQNCSYSLPRFVKAQQIGGLTGAATFDNYVTFHAMPGSVSTHAITTMPSGLISPFMLAICPPSTTCPPGVMTPGVTTCPAGWVSYTGTACTSVAGSFICCQKF